MSGAVSKFLHKPLGGILTGVLLALVAAVVQVNLEDVYPDYQAPYLIFFPMVYVASSLAGRQGGYACLVTSALAIGLAVYPPPSEVPPSILGMAVFLFAGAIIVRLHERMIMAVRARDQMVAMASHDLKNPLGAIRLQASVLAGLAARGPVDHERVAGAAALIERQVDRAVLLIGGLLDVARLRAGRFTLECDDVDLAGLVRDVVSAAGPELARGGYEVQLDGVERPQRGTWDRLRLEQVLANLLGNAVKYGRGRPLQVVVDGDDDVARVSVIDRGDGIPPAAHDELFQPFAKGPGAGMSSHGLGLWIVREVVEAHGGAISVDSERGRGTAFHVVLPKAARSCG